MEHSRLLKFFKPQRSIPDMAETPTFKVQIDYQKPENVEAEVPGSQEIREIDSDAVAEVTDDFTLSPVITVTKKEATFTKGDLKLQKVTVTEDIAMDEIQNGGQAKVTRTYQSLQRDGKTITRTTSSTKSYHEHSAIDDKPHEERKSRIPTLKFQQTVEKVKKDTKSRKKQDDEVAKRPRKSSIPKLSKETKIAIKKNEARKELAADDEFEKIYEQLAKQNDDDKVISVKHEDPEKLDSKFEELIHSYEEDDNTSVLQVERLRQTKIPALRRRKVEGDGSKMSSIVNNIRLQNAVRNSRELPIEDEFGEITTKTITTKRFDRVISREAADDANNTGVLKTTRIIKQTSKISTPVVTEKFATVDSGNVEEVTAIAHDNSNVGKEITETTRIVRQSSRIASPMITKVTRTDNIATMDANDIKIGDVTTIVDANNDSNDNNEEVTRTTRIIKQISKVSTPVVTKHTVESTKMDIDEDNVQEVSNSYDNNEEVTKTTRIMKQTSKIAQPVVTSVTRTENITKNTNDIEIGEVTKVDGYNDTNDGKEVTKTTRIIKQTSKIVSPVVTTVTRVESVTKNSNDAGIGEVTKGDGYNDSNDGREVTKTTRIIKQSSPIVTTITRTENITKPDTNNDQIKNAVTDNLNEDNKQVTKTTQIVRQSSKTTTPEVTTVTRTVTKIDTNSDTTDQDVTTNRIVTKHTSIPKVTDTKMIVVNTTESNVTDIGDTARNIARQKIIKEISKANPVITKGEVINSPDNINPDKIQKNDLRHEGATNTQSIINISKVVTQTSVNSDTGEIKESFKTDSTLETSSYIDDSITKGVTTKGVMITEQIARDGIRIGIPVFDTMFDESITATDVNDDHKRGVEADKERGSIKITHVTRTHSQESAHNVEIDKTLHWKADTNEIKNKLNEHKPINQHPIPKMSKTFVTKKINNIEKEFKPTEDRFKDQNTVKTDKSQTIFKKETKSHVIDVSNQKEMKDVKDKDSNTEEITVKGNVSRLINVLGTQEHREVHKDLSNDYVEVDIVNQERIRRLDKMISDFNKVDFKNIDLSKKELEYSVVSPQDREEDVTVLKGNVSRLIHKLGAKEPETNKSKDYTIFDEKSYHKDIKQTEYNIKHISTVGTALKKEIADTSDTTENRDNNNENKEEIIESVKGNDSFETKTADIGTVKLEKDSNIELGIVNAENKEDGSLLAENDTEKDEITRVNVSKLITKITQDIHNTELVAKDNENELPKKKSVLTKIAIFEQLEPKESYLKPHQTRTENKISKLFTRDIKINEKPRIVDEVLKSQAKFDPNDVDSKDVIGMISVDETTVRTEPVIVNEIWKTSLDIDRRVHNMSVSHSQEILSFESGNDTVEIGLNDNGTDHAYDKQNDEELTNANVHSNMYAISANDRIQNEATEATTESSKQIYDRVKHKYDIYEQNAVTMCKDIKRSESREYTLKHNSYTIENGATTADIKSEFTFDYPIVKSEGFHDSEVKTVEYDAGDFKYNKRYRFGSKEDYRRARSYAETDLGDAVNGKVNMMIGRMRSVDFERGNEGTVKAEKINIKEMPRKSSVLEKIALFEGKATTRFVSSTSRAPRVTKKAAFHVTTEDIRQEWTTEQGNVTTVKMEIVSELPPKIVEKPVITEEMYQEKIRELEAAKSLYQPVEVSTVTLGNGVKMPVIALGTALLEPRLIPHIIGAAIDLGYRAIDTAYIYGNEKAIGDAIKAKIDDGTVKREDLFILSKLWSTFHREDLVGVACNNSLSNLGLDYIDLFLIHNPMSFKEGSDPIPRIATVLQYSEHDYMDAWFAMEKLVTQGLVRSIGVSNFNSTQIQKILDKGRVKPVVNQVECHPYLSQERLDDFCASRNITLSCFGVLGSKGTPAEYKSSLPPAIDDPLVQVMARGLNVTSAQLLIRYQIESGRQAIVKASSAAHLKDNLDAMNFTLSEAQIKAVQALNRNKRMFTFVGMGETHKHYPFTAPY